MPVQAIDFPRSPASPRHCIARTSMYCRRRQALSAEHRAVLFRIEQQFATQLESGKFDYDSQQLIRQCPQFVKAFHGGRLFFFLNNKQQFFLLNFELAYNDGGRRKVIAAVPVKIGTDRESLTKDHTVFIITAILIATMLIGILRTMIWTS